MTEKIKKKAGNPNFGKGRPGPGRPKGCKDKIPRGMKERVLDVWLKLEKGGKGLHVQAKKDPQWFFTTMVKPMLPKEVGAKVDVDGDILIKIVSGIPEPKEGVK